MNASTDTTPATPLGERALAGPFDRDGGATHDAAIVVRDVEKSFRIPVHRRSTLKERALHPLTRIPSQEIHAARGVSFTVRRGEFFGIVGRNGSGKSTLLRMLVGIYRPDAGETRVDGRISPLIDLGVGFNLEMAARDNVLVNGSLLGLSRSEALRRFDEMLEFAGLQEFRELPLKNYSSGMLMRLGFSIAIHVDADVLLLDEVLAVGDAGFQDKCFAAFRRLKNEGKTIVLVTHAMEAVRRFCDRAMLLEAGRVVKIGDPADVAELYQDTVTEDPESGVHGSGGGRYGDGAADIQEMWVEDRSGSRSASMRKEESVALCAEVAFNEELKEPAFVFVIRSEDGRNVFSAATPPEQIRDLRFEPGDRVVVRMRFENHLGVGTYQVTPCVAHRDKAQWADARKDLFAFSVRGHGWEGALVDLPHRFEIEGGASR
ncbi:MAG TPA: ABC transporter ATP-binding protein [Solirubrobacterales bacterium]|nr:ABC transporter ATP-binding protein [Solirubrobacterales bacterium]